MDRKNDQFTTVRHDSSTECPLRMCRLRTDTNVSNKLGRCVRVVNTHTEKEGEKNHSRVTAGTWAWEIEDTLAHSEP